MRLTLGNESEQNGLPQLLLLLNQCQCIARLDEIASLQHSMLQKQLGEQGCQAFAAGEPLDVAHQPCLQANGPQALCNSAA